MNYFIICHKPTGNVFPQVIAKRGQTRMGFKSPDKVAPRLWTSLGSAKAWLTVYCRGVLFCEYDENGEGGLVIMPGTQRDITEYAIIPVQITNKR